MWGKEYKLARVRGELSVGKMHGEKGRERWSQKRVWWEEEGLVRAQWSLGPKAIPRGRKRWKMGRRRGGERSGGGRGGKAG